MSRGHGAGRPEARARAPASACPAVFPHPNVRLSAGLAGQPSPRGPRSLHSSPAAPAGSATVLAGLAGHSSVSLPRHGSLSTWERGRVARLPTPPVAFKVSSPCRWSRLTWPLPFLLSLPACSLPSEQAKTVFSS